MFIPSQRLNLDLREDERYSHNPPAEGMRTFENSERCGSLSEEGAN